MKKLARLKAVTETFGPEFVLPYRACYTKNELLSTIHEFRISGHSPSLRTDTPTGDDQGLLLPFLHPVSDEAAVKLWDTHKDTLVYIVCEGVSPTHTLCNATALRLDKTLLLVEYDEGGCAQRAWEHTCQPLRSAFCDRWDGWLRPVHPWGLVRIVPPHALPARTGIMQMYEKLLSVPDDMTVWTVSTTERIIVW